jgi:hypothetical protein
MSRQNALVHVGRDDAADLIGQPVEDQLVPRAHTQDRGAVREHAEPPAAVNQLRELVRLAMHRQLVVGKPEAAQDVEPLAVVPFRRVGQLAQLAVARHAVRPPAEFFRKRQGPDEPARVSPEASADV